MDVLPRGPGRVTALTESMGDEAAADLAVHFAELAQRQFGPGDRLIKTLGDAVLLASDGPASGLLLVRQILETCYRIDGFPIARAGLHHGPAVKRRDDMFGAAINLTARIAPQAAGGQVLGTAAIAESARAEGVETMTLGTFELRNVVEPVELWDVALCSAPEGGAVDPVCRLHVARARAAGRLRHRALDYWFCSLDCAATFAQAPARYAP
jgi:adenylate cyclase